MRSYRFEVHVDHRPIVFSGPDSAMVVSGSHFGVAFGKAYRMIKNRGLIRRNPERMTITLIRI